MRSAAIRSREISLPNISEISPRVTGWKSPRHQDPRLEFRQLLRVGRDVEGDAHRRAEGGTGVKGKTLPRPDQFDWPPAKIFAEVVEEEVDGAIAPDHARDHVLG